LGSCRLEPSKGSSIKERGAMHCIAHAHAITMWEDPRQHADAHVSHVFDGGLLINFPTLSGGTKQPLYRYQSQAEFTYRPDNL
jgi:hypothetical protein